MEEKLNEVLREQHLQQQRQMASSANHNNQSNSNSLAASIEDTEDGIEYDNDERKSLADDSATPVMLTDGQRRLGHCYFLLQLIISVCNLGCFILKLPFVVFVIRAVLEVLRARAQAEARVAHYEDPYGADEGMIHPSEIAAWTAEGLVSTTASPDAAGSGSTAAAKVEVLCLLLLYVGMLVVHLDVGCVLFCSSKCKGCLHLVVYFPLVGAWMFLAAFAYFVKQWQHTLSTIVLVFKLLIYGHDLFDPPNTWELVMLRSSLLLDLVTFMLTITYCIVACIWRRKKLPPCAHDWKPHYHLIRLL